MNIKLRKPGERRERGLKILLQHGADVNIPTNAGQTALQEAAAQGDMNCVEFLLKHHADVNSQADSGETALHWAAVYGTPEMMDLLIDSGADATAQTKAGETPGQWANHQKNRDEVKKLPPTVDEAFPVSGDKQLVNGSTWGVLIGIDCYPDGKAIDAGQESRHFADLRGCVNDALLVERYLTNFRGAQPCHIKKLVTGCQADGSLSPTCNNIIDAIESTADAAIPGDSVYIHFSGQGTTSVTEYPSLKGRRRADSVLFPQDYPSGGGCLRDIELEYLLQKMVLKGLAVTVVLDCDLENSMGGFPMSMSRLSSMREFANDRAGGPMSDKTLKFFDRGVHTHAANPFARPGGYTIFMAQNTVELREDGKSFGLMTYCLVNLLQDTSLDGLSCRGISMRLKAEMEERMLREGHGIVRRHKICLLGEPDRSFHGIGIAGEKETILTPSTKL